MTFDEFQSANERRSLSGKYPAICETPEFLSLAIAGEAGELANIIKKSMRGDFEISEKRTEILNELADIMTYCDKMINNLGGRTEQVLVSKFNEVCLRKNYPEGQIIL